MYNQDITIHAVRIQRIFAVDVDVLRRNTYLHLIWSHTRIVRVITVLLYRDKIIMHNWKPGYRAILVNLIQPIDQRYNGEIVHITTTPHMISQIGCSPGFCVGIEPLDGRTLAHVSLLIPIGDEKSSDRTSKSSWDHIADIYQPRVLEREHE